MRDLSEILTDVAATLPPGPLQAEVQQYNDSMCKLPAYAQKMGLTPTERAMLAVMLESDIAEYSTVKEKADIKTDDCLHVHAHRLRRKVEKFGFGRIYTIKGLGFTLRRAARA